MKYKRQTRVIALITALAVLFIGGGLYWLLNRQPEHDDNDDSRIAKSDQNENGQIRTADQITIDFGYLLTGDEEVTIEPVQIEAIESGVSVSAFDITLSSGQPGGVVEIIIDYTDEELTEEEEAQAVTAKYWQETSQAWEDVYYWVDTAKNQVHILTDHFSTYGVFTITDSNKRQAFISDVYIYAAAMNKSQAERILQAYAAHDDGWQEQIASSALTAFGSYPYFMASSAPALLSLGGAYDSLVGARLSNAVSGLGLATACTQLALDAYQHGMTSPEASFSAMKGLLSTAVNFASPAIQLAFVGVSAIDLALTDVSTFAVANKYKSTKNMYDAYYSRAKNSRSVADWREYYDLQVKANKQSPHLAIKKLEQEIDRYVNEYWDVSGQDWESWIDAYEKNGKLSKYPWPEKKHRDNISAIHKSEIYDSLQALFRMISREAYLDTLIQSEKAWQDVAALYNKSFSVNVAEQLSEDKTATLAGYYARMGPVIGTADPSSWIVRLGQNGNGVLRFTLLGHQSAGFPMSISVFRDQQEALANINALRNYTLQPFSTSNQTVLLSSLTDEEKLEAEAQVDETVESTELDTGIETEPTDIADDTGEPDATETAHDPEGTTGETKHTESHIEETNISTESETEETAENTASDRPEQPRPDENPWYEVVIRNTSNSAIFKNWSAVLAYPEDTYDLSPIMGIFNNKGIGTLMFQYSDYEHLGSPGKIWLYSNQDDLFNRGKPDQIISFSLSGGSRSGSYGGETLYTIQIKAPAPPQKQETDLMEAITGNYYLSRTYAENTFRSINEDGELVVDWHQVDNIEPGQEEPGTCSLHYNGESVTFKSDADPYLREFVLEKKSSQLYEYVQTEDDKTVSYKLEIITAGEAAILTHTIDSPSQNSVNRYRLTRR